MAGSMVRPTERWARVNHPAFLVALLVLVANDGVFKAEWPGVVTGKLSDAAGLFLLAALGFDLADRAAHQSGWRSGRRVAVALAVAAPFVAVNTNQHFATALRGVAGRVLDAVGGVLGWAPVIPGDGTRTVVVSDPSDLVALPAILLPLMLAYRHPRAPRRWTSDRPRSIPVSSVRTADVRDTNREFFEPDASVRAEPASGAPWH